MKVFAVMLAFNSPEMVEGGMQNFDLTVDDVPTIKKLLVDPGYPIPNVTENRERMKALAKAYGWDYVAIENEGVMGNWNKVVHELTNMGPDDFLVTFDPDVRMQEAGWLPCMVQALDSDPTAMFCAASRPFHNDQWLQVHPYSPKTTTLETGLRIRRWGCLIAWSMGMWKAEFLITRPRNFAASHKHYGYCEHADYDRLVANGKTWLQLADYYDHHQGATDQLYTDWKLACANSSTDLAFDAWLKSKGHRV